MDNEITDVINFRLDSLEKKFYELSNSHQEVENSIYTISGEMKMTNANIESIVNSSKRIYEVIEELDNKINKKFKSIKKGMELLNIDHINKKAYIRLCKWLAVPFIILLLCSDPTMIKQVFHNWVVNGGLTHTA